MSQATSSPVSDLIRIDLLTSRGDKATINVREILSIENIPWAEWQHSSSNQGGSPSSSIDLTPAVADLSERVSLLESALVKIVSDVPTRANVFHPLQANNPKPVQHNQLFPDIRLTESELFTDLDLIDTEPITNARLATANS